MPTDCWCISRCNSVSSKSVPNHLSTGQPEPVNQVTAADASVPAAAASDAAPAFVPQQAHLEYYLETFKDTFGNDKHIPDSKLSRLTPYEAALAVMAEISLLEKDETVFGKAVYTSLLRVSVGDGTHTLNLPRLVQQFLELCDYNYEEEYQTATFNSLYRTWVDKESYNYKVNLTGKEQHTIVNDANFCQLLKVLIYLMGEMFRRFFQTYDPMEHDTSRSLYTIYGDKTKQQRTSIAFITFLQDYRRIYTEFCKMTVERTEVYLIFRNATAEARAFIEDQKRQRALRKETESVRARATTFYGRRRIAREAVAAANATASTAKPREPAVFSPPPPSVWSKPMATAEVVAPVVEVETVEEEEFTPVKTKAKAKAARK